VLNQAEVLFLCLNYKKKYHSLSHCLQLLEWEELSVRFLSDEKENFERKGNVLGQLTKKPRAGLASGVTSLWLK
jgi:hypothetical protein